MFRKDLIGTIEEFGFKKGPNGELLVAGHTNKNWFSLKKELDQVKDVANLPSYEDRQDKESILEDKEVDKI